MLRVALLVVFFILILVVIWGFYFFIKNEEVPLAIILKLITPILIGIAWLFITIFENDRSKEDFFEGLIVTNTENIPFRFYDSNLNEKFYFQNNLPIPYGKTDDHVKRIIAGGIWITLKNISGPVWQGKKSRLIGFGSSSMYVDARHVKEGSNEVVNLQEKLLNLKVMEKDDFSGSEIDTNIGLPKGSVILGDGLSEIAIKTPELLFTIKLSFVGFSSISDRGKNEGDGEYELIKYASNTHQARETNYGSGLIVTNRVSGLSADSFRVELSRKVNWWSQWSSATKEQIKWTDQLFDGLRENIKFNSYRDEFYDDLSKVNSRVNEENVVALNINDFFKKEEVSFGFEKDQKGKIINILNKYLELEFNSVSEDCISVLMNGYERQALLRIAKGMGIIMRE